MKYLTKTVFLNYKYIKRNNFSRCFSVLYNNEWTVPQFCNIFVNCPYNVTVKPLDVYKYCDNNKLIINVHSKSQNESKLQCRINNDSIFIDESSASIDDAVCLVEAPVKANINVLTKHGNIHLDNFHNDNIKLESYNGNITINKCQSKEIILNSTEGNIESRDVLQAAKIKITTSKLGKITVSRLQGLNLYIKTDNGNITTQSSYCQNSKFITNNGNLNLNNIHKNCNIQINGEGNLKLNGFDGSLQAYLNTGNSDMQISQIISDSKIIMNTDGYLILRLDENCQKNTYLKIDTKNLHLEENVKLLENENNSVILCVECKNGTVNVSSCSWLEMFKTNFNKSNTQ